MTRGRDQDRRLKRYAAWLSQGLTLTEIAAREGLSCQAVSRFCRDHFSVTWKLKNQPEASDDE